MSPRSNALREACAELSFDGEVVDDRSVLATHRPDGFLNISVFRHSLDEFLQLIEASSVFWVVTASITHGVAGPHFVRLLTALTRTDTDLCAADDDENAVSDLVMTFLDYEIMLDVMRCRKAIKPDAPPYLPLLETVHSLVSDIHEVTVVRQQNRLASLSQKERELYEAASEEEPRSAADLCKRTPHALDSQAKTCLATLTKLGLFKKVKGRSGYLRVPAKS